LTEEDSKKGILQRISGLIDRFERILNIRYVWLGLIAGFLWSFPAPFILYAIASANWSLPYEAVWVVFFPITSSVYMVRWIVGPEGYINFFLLWIFSIAVGMIISLAIAYSIHRIRILMRGKK
jgi:hypothetical protein